MSGLNLQAIKGSAFQANASQEGTGITVRFSGTADLNAREQLENLLLGLHSEAQRLGVSEVAIDFRQLEFMNSSCFKGLVGWLSGVQDLEAEKQYRIRLLSKPEMLWQRRSLHALRCFAVDLISIET
jgi:hypothetical protein